MFFLQARRAPPVSYLGCLIVVLALALDPFAQQILQYQPLKTAVPQLNSTVSHSQVYNWGTARVFGGNSESASPKCHASGVNMSYNLTLLTIKPPQMILASYPATCPASAAPCRILHSHAQVLTALSHP